jgi:hypothetical protein
MAKDSWDGLATEKAMAEFPGQYYAITFSYPFASRPFEHFETCMESNPIFVIPRRDA